MLRTQIPDNCSSLSYTCLTKAWLNTRNVEMLSTPGDIIMNIFIFLTKIRIILELYIGCDDT